MSTRNPLLDRIERLEKIYKHKKAEEVEKRNALASSMESGGSEEIASSLISLQVEIRSMEDVINHKKEELQAIEAYSNSSEAKADRLEMNKLLVEHEKKWQAVKAGAHELYSIIEDLFSSISKYDALSKRNGMAMDPVFGYISIKRKKKYEYIWRLQNFMAQWIKDEKWLHFKL